MLLSTNEELLCFKGREKDFKHCFENLLEICFLFLCQISVYWQWCCCWLSVCGWRRVVAHFVLSFSVGKLNFILLFQRNTLFFFSNLKKSARSTLAAYKEDFPWLYLLWFSYLWVCSSSYLILCLGCCFPLWLIPFSFCIKVLLIL